MALHNYNIDGDIMIKGIGIDLVEINRIKNIKVIDNFIKRILSEKEIEIYHNYQSDDRKYQFLAGRFAAKEAYSKAIGTGIGKIAFKDIEILNDLLGKPYIIVKEDLNCFVSITHTEHYACAEVIIEYK
ncbi:MAG: dpj [Haloplasmataceae bacterium]|jgi:holo-[acyl-carrier protein] synthase|nr:dpj [Haloplasmataceae bacterium]